MYHTAFIFILFTIYQDVCYSDIKPSKFPRQFERCRKNSPHIDQCLKRAIQNAFYQAAKGIPESGLVPIDPLFTSEVSMVQRYGPVTMDINYRNVTARGYAKSVIERISSDIPNYFIKLYGFMPEVVVKGHYNMKSVMLQVPIEGDGDFVVILKNITGSVSIKGKNIRRANSNFMDVTKVETDINPSKIIYNLKNLFNGNKELGKIANKFLNQFSDIIYKYSKPAFEETMNKVYIQVIRGFFDVVPYEEIFL